MNTVACIVVIVILILVLIVWYLPGCSSCEGYRNDPSDHQGDPTKVSAQSFTSGITPAIRRRQLSRICKLLPGFELSAIAPTGMRLPESFDLRDYNFLTPIMNQEMCGGCWAFATVGCLADRINFLEWVKAGRPGKDSGWKSQYKDLLLTPQYLLSCDNDPSANGCEGSSNLVQAIKACTKGNEDMKFGLPNGTFLYWVHPFDVCQHETGSGVVSQNISQGEGIKCSGQTVVGCDLDHMRFHFESGTPVFTFRNYYPVNTGDFGRDIQKLKEEIYNNGPVCLGIGVYSNMYDDEGDIKKGVIQTASGSFEGGHAVLCVGWGPNYLIIKNSWGPEWGMDGYWFQSINDRNTLIFSGSSLNMAAGIPTEPDIDITDLIVPVIPK